MLNIALMGLIMLTGNYNFFNILTIALCVCVFDDEIINFLGLYKNISVEIAQGLPSFKLF